MIKNSDVLRMKIPYPKIDSKLAYQAHMYICYKKEFNDYKFIKCQTLKPYMIGENNPVNNFIDEFPNENRNPFTKHTRIDCDKLFNTSGVWYSDKLLTSIRRDICKELYDELEFKIKNIDISIVKVIEKDLIMLNKFIRFIDGV